MRKQQPHSGTQPIKTETVAHSKVIKRPSRAQTSELRVDNIQPEDTQTPLPPPASEAPNKPLKGNRVKSKAPPVPKFEENQEASFNDLFKEVVDFDTNKNKWDFFTEKLSKLYIHDPVKFTTDSLDVVLKIIAIQATKASEDLLSIFLGMYGTLTTLSKEDKNFDVTYPFFITHIDAASQISKHPKKKFVSVKGFQWLETLIMTAPLKFYRDSFKKVTEPENLAKVIYARSLHVLIGTSQGPGSEFVNQSEPSRLNALRIASKIKDMAYLSKFAEEEALKNKVEASIWERFEGYVIKALMEDEKETIRSECLKLLPINEANMKFLTIKTLDNHPLVRAETYKQLTSFLNRLDHDQKHQTLPSMSANNILMLIENGLSDPSQQVADACIHFLKVWLLRNDDAEPAKRPVQRGRKPLNPQIPLNLISLQGALSKLDFEKIYQHPKLAEVLHLFVKEVIQNSYDWEEQVQKFLQSSLTKTVRSQKADGLEAATETAQNSLLIVDLLNEEQNHPQLFQELLLKNNLLHIFFSRVISGERQLSLDDEILLPQFDEIQQILKKFEEIKVNFEHISQFQEQLSNMIIYQALALLQYRIYYLASIPQEFIGEIALKDQAAQINSIIDSVIKMNDYYFAVDRANKDDDSSGSSNSIVDIGWKQVHDVLMPFSIEEGFNTELVTKGKMHRVIKHPFKSVPQIGGCLKTDTILQVAFLLSKKLQTKIQGVNENAYNIRTLAKLQEIITPEAQQKKEESDIIVVLDKIEKYQRQLRQTEEAIENYIKKEGEQPDESAKRERVLLKEKLQKYIKILPRILAKAKKNRYQQLLFIKCFLSTSKPGLLLRDQLLSIYSKDLESRQTLSIIPPGVQLDKDYVWMISQLPKMNLEVKILLGLSDQEYMWGSGLIKELIATITDAKQAANSVTEPDTETIEIGVVALRGLLDIVVQRRLFTLENEEKEEEKANVKHAILHIMRDNSIHCQLKVAMVEGLTRLLMVPNDILGKPQDFIAGMILQYFERPDSYTEEDPLTRKQKSIARFGHQQKAINEMRLILDTFFKQYARMSPKNSDNLFKASVQALYFLVRGKQEYADKPQQWKKGTKTEQIMLPTIKTESRNSSCVAADQQKNQISIFQKCEDINMYKIIAKFAHLLHYANINTSNGAFFDMRKHGISYQYQYITAFANIAYLQNQQILTDSSLLLERNLFYKFLTNALQFIYPEEIPLALNAATFEEIFVEQISPVLASLRQSELQENLILDKSPVDRIWDPLVRAHLQFVANLRELGRNLPQSIVTEAMIFQFKNSEIKKLKETRIFKQDCEEQHIYEECRNFYGSMTYSNEQKLVVESDIETVSEDDECFVVDATDALKNRDFSKIKVQFFQLAQQAQGLLVTLPRIDIKRLDKEVKQREANEDPISGILPIKREEDIAKTTQSTMSLPTEVGIKRQASERIEEEEEEIRREEIPFEKQSSRVKENQAEEEDYRLPPLKKRDVKYEVKKESIEALPPVKRENVADYSDKLTTSATSFKHKGIKQEHVQDYSDRNRASEEIEENFCPRQTKSAIRTTTMPVSAAQNPFIQQYGAAQDSINCVGDKQQLSVRYSEPSVYEINPAEHDSDVEIIEDDNMVITRPTKRGK